LEDALSLLSAGDQDAARCVTGAKEKDVRLGMPSDVLDTKLLRIAGEFLSGSYVAKLSSGEACKTQYTTTEERKGGRLGNGGGCRYGKGCAE
jgi:hypothetical protein